MSNWKVFSESQDEECQSEPELGIFLSQPVSSLHERPQEEAGPSQASKRPRLNHQWYGNLQPSARALVILLQVGSMEPGSKELTFEGSFEGLNDDQYSYCLKPVKGSNGHQRWLEGPVNLLAKEDRAEYVALTVQRILKFLQVE